MNKKRRRRISDLIIMLRNVEICLNTILNEEDDARDAMPESFEATDSYALSEEASDSMEEALGLINDAIDLIESIV